jgi:tRNA A37 threonylcarbamoyladenosine dehydratase
VPTWLGRTALLVGEGAMGRFAEARVLLVGLGGVGGYTAEFLVRSGVGHITIVDGDSVDPTNRNRQLIALSSTEGRPKSAVLAERLRDINPSCHVTARQEFVPADPAQVDALVASEPFDFVIDAIDSLQPKVRTDQTSKPNRPSRRLCRWTDR